MMSPAICAGAVSAAQQTERGKPAQSLGPVSPLRMVSPEAFEKRSTGELCLPMPDQLALRAHQSARRDRDFG